MVDSSKNAEMISGMDELLDYTKGFLDDDALQYVKEVLDNNGDDIAQLKKIAQLVEDGSRKIGKKLKKSRITEIKMLILSGKLRLNNLEYTVRLFD